MVEFIVPIPPMGRRHGDIGKIGNSTMIDVYWGIALQLINLRKIVATMVKNQDINYSYMHNWQWNASIKAFEAEKYRDTSLLNCDISYDSLVPRHFQVINTYYTV